MNHRNYIKYGVPVYSAAWVPDNTPHNSKHLVLAGGGGEGNSGVENAIILLKFDPASAFLSDEPVAKHLTGSELPYRIAVHPGGDGLICAFQNRCSWFEWEKVEEDGVETLAGVKRSDRVVLTRLQQVGQQLAVAFNQQGTVLATGGEDGNFRVFKWPSMDVIFIETKAHATSVKQLSFSPDGKFLVSLGHTGPGRVWNILEGSFVTLAASLPTEKDEVFCACEFGSQEVLHLADKGGVIVTWSTTTWKRIRSKKITSDGIMSFDVSADGKLIACGTPEGNVFIVESDLRKQNEARKAHSGFITTLSFSRDSRALASASMDSSARVSSLFQDVEKKHEAAINSMVILLTLLLSIVAYFIIKLMC